MRTIEQLNCAFAVHEASHKHENFRLTTEEMRYLLEHVGPRKTFEIPVSYRMGAILKIPAYSVAEAIELAEEWEFDVKTGEYMDDSWEVDEDEAKILAEENE